LATPSGSISAMGAPQCVHAVALARSTGARIESTQSGAQSREALRTLPEKESDEIFFAQKVMKGDELPWSLRHRST
jgi:hypothetical protein